MNEISQPQEAPKSPRKSGRGVSKGLTRELILKVTKAVIADVGFDSFRIVDVSSQLDVKPSAIYNFFPSRDDLLAALARNVSEDTILYGEPEKSLSAHAKLDFIIDNLVRIYVTDTLVPRIQIFDLADKAGKARSARADLLLYSRGRLQRILDEGVEQGVFRRVSLDNVRPFLIGSITMRVLWHTYEPDCKAATHDEIRDEIRLLMHRYLAV